MRFDDLNNKEFELLERLEDSVLVRTYMARQGNLGRYVSIRQLISDQEEVSHRFRNEAAALAALRHPNNCRLLDAGAATIDGSYGPYFVFETVVGETLESALRRVESLQTAQILRLAQQLLGALAEAHRNGILHRQLSPQSLHLSQHEGMPDHLTIVDYGIEACIAPNRWSRLVREARMTCTPYLAPEVLAGEPPSARSDLYSAASLLYRCTVGVAFSATDDTDVDVKAPRFDRLSLLRMEMIEVFDRALRVDPNERYLSANEFLEALEPVVEKAHDAALVGPSMSRLSTQATGTSNKMPGQSLISKYPSVWILAGDPALDDTHVARLVKATAHYRVLVLDREKARATAESVKLGHAKLPWVVIFGDLHVILQVTLLNALRELPTTQRILVSAKLNAQMLEAAVNFCGTDRHLLLPMDEETLAETIEEHMAKCRRQLQRSELLEAQRLGLEARPGRTQGPRKHSSITGKFAAVAQERSNGTP
ncbi:MAG: hypothetical protein COW42_11160 [Deltaproteobacteria bacterium CG17_big_fil_post_rev_8_21_14_2_50_63_7]|nr:MAG: hypothetical protein COW42_11160 [Deltaproteobacteria bacterium CG17_big_fil_post_rev_8_21_14_2_50_63_7]